MGLKFIIEKRKNVLKGIYNWINYVDVRIFEIEESILKIYS